MTIYGLELHSPGLVFTELSGKQFWLGLNNSFYCEILGSTSNKEYEKKLDYWDLSNTKNTRSNCT